MNKPLIGELAKNACLPISRSMNTLRLKEDRIYFLWRVERYILGMKAKIKEPLPTVNE